MRRGVVGKRGVESTQSLEVTDRRSTEVSERAAVNDAASKEVPQVGRHAFHGIEGVPTDAERVRLEMIGVVLNEAVGE